MPKPSSSTGPADSFFKALSEALADSGGLSRSPDDLAAYGTDWSGALRPAPCAVVFPRSTEEVARVLEICSRHRVAVVPSGGRTGLSGGAVAANGELVLSLSKMNRIGPLDPRAATLEVEAGAVTQAVHEFCAPYGLTWPVDFASKGSSQVGGNIATNAGGVRVIRYGSTRSWVLGLKAVRMDGTFLSLNGDLEKNNTGPDLRQLFIGSEGILGVITEATLKLTRPPERVEVGFFALEGFAQLLKLFEEARRGPFGILAFECLDRACYEASLAHQGIAAPVAQGAGAYALLEIERPASEEAWARVEEWLAGAIERGWAREGILARSPGEQRKLWRIREGVAESVFAGAPLRGDSHAPLRGDSHAPSDGDSAQGGADVHQHDVSVGIARLESFAGAIAERYRSAYPGLEVFVFGHIGDGNLHVFIRRPAAMSQDEFRAAIERSDGDLFEFVRSHRGSISAEHGIGVLKKKALPYSRSAAEIELLRAIKKAFDPQGLLNPGKVI